MTRSHDPGRVRFAEGQREKATCGWCNSPIWMIYHGSNQNHTREPRMGECSEGMCWAEALQDACDHWKREAECARTEVRVWKERLVTETARLRDALAEARADA